MNILLLKGYNNRFNRILKKEDTIANYKAAVVSGNDLNYLELTSINFNPNDGIATSLTIGKGDLVWDDKSATDTLREGKYTPDYCIAYDTNGIVSRWFVTEVVRTRGGQYTVSLVRDVLADFYDDVKNAPCYIEKAMITDETNPLLFNREGLAVNQIKKEEHLIKDSSGVAWVVGYVARNLTGEVRESNFGTVTLDAQGKNSGAFTSDKANVISGAMWLTNLDGSVTYATGNSGDGKFTYTIDSLTKTITYSINIPAQANTQMIMRFKYTVGNEVDNNGYTAELASDINRVHLEDAPYDMFCIPFGEIHLESANVNTTKESALAIALGLSEDLGTFLYDVQLLPYCPRNDMVISGKVYEILGYEDIDWNYIKQGNTIKNILIWCKKSTFTASGLVDGDLYASIKIDRPIDNTIKPGELTVSDGRLTRLAGGYIQVRVSNSAFSKVASVENIAGVQVSHSSTGYNVATTSTRNLQHTTGSSVVKFEVYDGGDERFPSGTLTNATVTVRYGYKDYQYPEYMDLKVSNECDLYRLVSPNYNGQFEWSIAKNGGYESIFDIDCTYKPFQPYIHVVPQFASDLLYGGDFDDARGLICGGDFSLPIISDAWTQYQIQNKTYQEMFDRQIYHMDVQQSYAQSSSGAAQMQGVVNDILGTTSNMIHSKNGYQAAASGILGAGRLISDLGFSDLQRTYQAEAYLDTRDFTIDMFNYSLQNVQALPYNLTKVAAYTANNKIFPMVEVFTCKDVEKQALRDKIQFNGMTVMVIGKISDYVDANEKRFIKGQLIRLPDIKDDSHVANALYDEINKGVYI